MRKIYLLTLLLFANIACFAQWQQVNNGINNLATGARLIGSSNSHLFAVSIASGVYKTKDNGNNWTQVQVPVGFTSPPKCGYHANGKYFVGFDKSMDCISYSTDEGTTWNTPLGGPQSTVVRGFISLSGNIFAYTSGKGIYKSTDGGTNWGAANSGLTSLNVAWMTTINTKIIAATIGAGVFVSSDNGVTWVQSNSGVTGNLNSTFVWQMGPTLYYYTLQGNLLYSSTNEGLTWATATKPAFLQSSTIGKTISIKEVYRNGSNLYMIARTQYGLSITDSVFITSNEGTAWTNITGNLPADVLGSGITEFGGNIFIAYGSANEGIYRRSNTVGITENHLSNLMSIYPNPFNDIIVLSGLPNEKIRQISIYNNQGKIVLSEDNNMSSMNTSELDNGLYIIEIMFLDNSTVHRKLIKESTNR